MSNFLYKLIDHSKKAALTSKEKGRRHSLDSDYDAGYVEGAKVYSDYLYSHDDAERLVWKHNMDLYGQLARQGNVFSKGFMSACHDLAESMRSKKKSN